MNELWILAVGLLVAGCANEGQNQGLRAEFEQATGDAEPVAGAETTDGEPSVTPAAEPEKPKLIPITKREARLVDKQKAMQENPALIEVENKINASDPFTAAAQSYFTIGSKAQVLAMQHTIKIQRELNDRWPTFEEFENSIKQAGVKLTAIYPYQMYAYDDSTGGLTILEDRAEMKRQYEAAGRDYPHAD